MARSWDGSRLAVGSATDATLWLRDASGTATKQWFRTGNDYALGFDTSGRAWVLEGLDYFWDSTSPSVLFEEQ